MILELIMSVIHYLFSSAVCEEAECGDGAWLQRESEAGHPGLHFTGH